MWIFTVNGFFTIIQDRKDANFVWLRARLREDIERNFPGVEVQEHPGADYLFRAKLPREQVAQRVMELVMENDVTSHFKDVMIRTASKPEFGSRSQMLYGVWNAGAAMQPYAPYSKVPRSKVQPWQKTTPAQGRQPGTGQTAFSYGTSTYGGSGSGRYGSEFDWDRQAWGGGESSPDPKMPSKAASSPATSGDSELARMTDDEFDAWWGSLSDEERDRVLDEEEAAQREREAIEEDFGAAVRAQEHGRVPTMADVSPAPRSRTGSRKSRRKAKRANRHNQERTPDQQARFEQDRRDGRHGSEARNRQAFLDKHNGGNR